MKKGNFFYQGMTILLSFLLCVACQDKSPQLLTVENKYQLAIPYTLKAVTQLDNNASLEYANYTKELYFTLIETPKNLLQEQLGAAMVKTDSLPNLHTYSNFIASTFKYTVNASSVNLQQLGDKYYLEFDGETPKAKIYYQVLFAEDEKQFYQLICWTLKERKELFKTEMKALLKSFECI